MQKEAEKNKAGWESLAEKWKDVKWPRRPKWKGEWERVGPLLSEVGKEVLIFGATPEFRAWMKNARITVYEKSEVSYRAMTKILKSDFGVEPKNEEVVMEDWGSDFCEKNRYSILLGDAILGYLGTKEAVAGFLEKAWWMMKKGGYFVLREFSHVPRTHNGYMRMPVDLRRWAYIMTPGFAIEGGVFYEEMLAERLKEIGDYECLGTCANPPRTRVIFTPKESESLFSLFFEVEMVIGPTSSTPGLWVLKK